VSLPDSSLICSSKAISSSISSNLPMIIIISLGC
jgi:hypothetical protein